MGNKHSTLAEGDFETFSQNYAYIKKFNDTRFGDVKLLQERSTGAKIFQKDYISNTTKDFEKDLNEIKRRASVNHPNIIRIIGYTTKKEDAFCADYYKISVFYECYDYDLEHENFVRAQRKDRYPETELWYILDCIVTAGAHLEANEEAHGDIRPYNVLVSVNKEYKIVDNKLFNGGNLPSFYSLMNELENKGRYFSPEVFAFFGKKDKKEKFSHNKYKSDIYSLGLTLLECATLKNLDYLYNWETFEVNQTKIEEELRNLQNNKTYSPTLIETLRFMLNIDEEHRPNFLKLDSELSQYRADIKARVLKSEIETSATPVIHINSNEQEEHHEYFDEEELDRRIKAAIEKSEETIRNSPAKHITENLNAYYDKFVSGNTPAAHETSNGTQAHSTHTRQPQQEKRSQPVASAYDGTSDYKSGATGATGGYGNYGTTGASGTSYTKPTATTGTTGAYGGASTTVGANYKPTSTGAIGGTTGAYTAGTYGAGKLSGDRTSPKNATVGASGTTFGTSYGQPGVGSTYVTRKVSGDRTSPKNSTVVVGSTYGQTGGTGSYSNGAQAARKVSGERTSPKNTSIGATGATFTSAYGQAGTTGGYTAGAYGANKTSVDRTSPKNSTIGITGTSYGQVGAGTTTGTYGARKVSGDRTSPKNATSVGTTYGTTTYGQTGTGYTPSTYGTTSGTAGKSSPKNATSGTTSSTYGATYAQPTTGTTGGYTPGTYGAANLSGGRSSPKNATSSVTGTYGVSPVNNTTGTTGTTYGASTAYGTTGTTYGQTGAGATGTYGSYGATRPNATSTTGTTGAAGSYTSGAKYTPGNYSYGGAVSTSKTAV